MYVRGLIGSSALIYGSYAAMPIVRADEPVRKDAVETKKLCRPSELPLYPTPTSIVSKVKTEEPSDIEKSLAKPIAIVRENVFSVLNEGKGAMNKVLKTTSDTAENFKFIVTYLREEDNETQRIGAVAMGTVTGFIFGLRGGLIKKVFYSLTGTGVMGAICFPEETNIYLTEGKKQAKLLANIGYNFVYGIKPGDPQPEINFPDIKIPTNFQDVIDLTVNIGSSIKETVLPSKSKNE